MLDIKILRENPEFIKKICEYRRHKIDIDELLTLDETFRKLLLEIEQIRKDKNILDNNINHTENAKELKDKLTKLEQDFKYISEKRMVLLNQLPNIIAPDTPLGLNDKDNITIASWGQIPEFNFKPKSHIDLGASLKILDLQRGSKVCGSGFYYWLNDGALLFNAVYNLAEQLLCERGFIPMRTPIMTKPEALYGTGYLPFFQEELFNLEEKNLTLIGTSEQSILPYHLNEIVEYEQLPLLYCAFSPCFRSEAGAAGRANKGAFRVHQFHKLEQIIICSPEESEYWHYQCQKNAEDIMQALELPYRVVRVCIGDLGAPAYKKYDIEGWFAGFDEYRETHSNTNLLSYQSRRLNLRYKDNTGKKIFPHTISSTAITDRAIIAIMENNQTKDGTIIIPNKLVNYMNGKKEITGKMPHKIKRNELTEFYSRDNKSTNKIFIKEDGINKLYEQFIISGK